MSEAMGPIAKTLLAGGDDADRTVPCCVCGKPTPLPNFIWESVRLWNRDELKLAERESRKANFINTHELGMCCPGACNAEEHHRRHRAYAEECAQTRALFSMLCAGKYNPESLAWLRAHGMAKQVAKILAKEGTVKAHAPGSG